MHDDAMLPPTLGLFTSSSPVEVTSKQRIRASFVAALAAFALMGGTAHARMRASTIILVGEMHGTNEGPRMFGNLVKVASARGDKPIGVGLELPVGLQPILEDAARQRASCDAFRQHLTAAPEWEKFEQFQDGRSSEAMLDLLCEVVALAGQSRVSVFFFDTHLFATHFDDADEKMAQAIAAHIRKQKIELTLILTGNIHANRAPHVPARPAIRPMGWFLASEGFVVRSFDTRYNDGDTWACIGPCGVHHLTGNAIREGKPVPPGEGYDDILFLGAITASPPVKQ